MISMAEAADYKELNPEQVAYYDGMCRSELKRDQTNDRYAIPSEQYIYDRRSKCKPGRHSGMRLRRTRW